MIKRRISLTGEISKMLDAGKVFFIKDEGNAFSFRGNRMVLELGDVVIIKELKRLDNDFDGIEVDAIKYHEILKRLEINELDIHAKKGELLIKEGGHLEGKIADFMELKEVFKKKYIGLPLFWALFLLPSLF